MRVHGRRRGGDVRQDGPVILVRKETMPDDIHGMEVAKGILTARRRQDQPRGRGGARHGTCPAWWAPGASRSTSATSSSRCSVGGKNDRGQGRRLDFARRHHRRRCTWARPRPMEPDPNSGVLRQVHGAGPTSSAASFGVRANADIPRDAKAARAFGAEGIGLCRTEHMFFAEDRIPHVQAMILARRREDAPQGARRSCCPCSARISPGCSRRWTASRW